MSSFNSLDALEFFPVGLTTLDLGRLFPPTGILGQAYSFASYLLGVLGREQASLRFHHRALATADSASDEHARADILRNWSGYLVTLGRWDEAITHARQANAIVQTVGPVRPPSPLSVWGYAEFMRGDLAKAERLFDEMLEGSRTSREAYHAMSGQVKRAAILLRRGDLGPAMDQLEDCEDLVRTLGVVPMLVDWLSLVAWCAWSMHEVDRSRSTMVDALEIMARADAFTHPAAYDGFARAARLAIVMWRRAVDEGVPGTGTPRADVETAVGALKRLHRGLPISGPILSLCQAWIRHLDGRDASRWWEEAAVRARAMSMPFELAVVLHDHATTLVEGDPSRLALLEEVRQISGSHGFGPPEIVPPPAARAGASRA